MLVALLLPKVLDRISDRTVMLAAGLFMSVVPVTFLGVWFALKGHPGWTAVIPAWTLLGMAYAGLVTPAGGCCGVRLSPPIYHSSSLPNFPYRMFAG